MKLKRTKLLLDIESICEGGGINIRDGLYKIDGTFVYCVSRSLKKSLWTSGGAKFMWCSG